MPPTNPLRFAHSKQVVAAWAWVFCALDLVIPTIFYLGLSLGYHAPGETNRVAIRDYFLLRLGLAAVAMGHLKLSTHAEGRSPRRVRMGAVAVSILTFVFGIVTFLIVYLLMLRVTFGSSVSDVADVDQLGWGVSAPGFGYIGDCESSSRALSHAPSAVPCPVPTPERWNCPLCASRNFASSPRAHGYPRRHQWRERICGLRLALGLLHRPLRGRGEPLHAPDAAFRLPAYQLQCAEQREATTSPRREAGALLQPLRRAADARLRRLARVGRGDLPDAHRQVEVVVGLLAAVLEGEA